MRKEGSQFTCERCGKTTFFEGGGSFNETAGSIKWELIQGKHFCDGCSTIFRNWFEGFLDMKDSVTVTIDIAKDNSEKMEDYYKRCIDKLKFRDC